MPEKKSFWDIVLEHWVPALITAVIGGILVAVLAPSLQTRFADSSIQKKRKLDLWESIGDNFTNYTLWRSRLNYIAQTEESYGAAGKPLSKELETRKEHYVSERDRYLNLLRRDLLLAGYYFEKPEVKKKVDDFLTWHSQFRTATVDKLPADDAYYKWRDSIMEAIKPNL